MEALSRNDLPKQLNILLVGDDAGQSSFVQESLSNGSEGYFYLEWVRNPTKAIERLKYTEFSIVLLDLESLSAAQAEDIRKLSKHSNNALIVVMVANDDEELGRQAITLGANDYVVKNQLNPYWLRRSLNYLIDCHRSRRSLVDSDARFRAISDASPLGIFVADAYGNCVYTNAAYQKISGLSFDETLGSKWSKAVHPDDRQQVLSKWHKAALKQIAFKSEFRFLRADGTVVWTRVNSAPMSTGTSPTGYVQTVEDISERILYDIELKRAEEALFEANARAQVTLNSIGDAVMTSDLQGRVTYLNLVAESMTGWTSKEAIGKPVTEVFHIIHSKTGDIAPDPSSRAIAEDIIVGLAADSLLVRRDGLESPIEDSAAPIHDRNGTVSGAVIVFHDVTQSRAMALKMTHLAQHDFLTDLPNRLLLEDRLTQAIAHARRHHKLVSLLFIDLDYFKKINDSLGHSVGDKLLQSVARRLQACVRSEDTVCRQGGDEFIILLTEIEHPRDASYVAEKVLSALSEPYAIDENELHITPSIGISVFPADGIDADTLIQNADTAMYHAKEAGRNRFRLFMPEMNIQAVQRMETEVRLRRALKQGEFLLHYQPKVDLTSGLLTGIEALIRWQDPNLGLLYPINFISIAEECGLIVPIGCWVLRESCRQIQVWREMDFDIVPVAVNISAVEFRHKDFLNSLTLILKETGTAPQHLQLEITESVLMHETESSTELLKSLQAIGVKLAIDDFGTGNSSLSYLKRFPIDSLKIDQSFVRDITANTDDATIVAAVIAMGRNLNQRVIAEGIETKEQLEFLQTQCCDEGQGFWFSRPISSKRLTHLLETNGHNFLS